MSSVPGYTTAQIAAALSSLPMMSLVTTNANMFGPDGIYANSEDKSLEVPGSFEYFNPLSGTTAFGSLAEISMYGGVGRDTQYLKHGMEVHFENAEGKSYLDENIFGDGYLPDGLILRQAFNDGWSWGGASTQFIIDQWTRDALTALGTQNTPGIWVQLFVNGLYWGVYNAVADIDSDYAAYFFGGQKSDYDVYHYSSTGFEVKSGSITPWDDLFNVATYGNIAGTGTASPTVLANPTAYALMAQYLNLPDFCDYIIVNYYGGNWDWDWHNYSALFSPTLGFVFQDWDGEGMLQDPNANITNRDTTGDPTQLFVQLLANPDFRQMFADHVYKDLNTVLSPTTAAAMYTKEANTISAAVLDEAARWGNLGELDGTWGGLGTPATWTARYNWELGTFFPDRTATMFNQFETAVTFTPAAGGNTVHLHDVSELRPAHAVHQRDGRERRDVHARRRAHHDSRHGHDLLYDRRQRSADQQQRFHGLQHRAQWHDGHGHAGRCGHRPVQRRIDLYQRGRAKRLRQQFRHRQRDREFHRRDHHLHLHGERFARFARYACD